MGTTEEFFGYDDVFYKEIADGHRWARHVAQLLQSNLIECHVDDPTIAKTRKEVALYRSEQDIILDKVKGCIEVKSRDLYFTNEPRSFPYETAFVDTCFGWDSKNPKPLAVALVSKKTSCVIVVPVSSQSRWGKRKTFDRQRRIEDVWYTVDRAEIKPFSELVKFLQVRQNG